MGKINDLIIEIRKEILRSKSKDHSYIVLRIDHIQALLDYIEEIIKVVGK